MIGRVGLVSSSDAGAVFSGFRRQLPGRHDAVLQDWKRVVFPLSWEWCGSHCTRWPRQAASSDTRRNLLRPLCIGALHHRRLLCLVTPRLTANLAPEPTLHGSDILSGRTQITVPAAIILRYRLWPDAERFLTMPQSVVWTISIVGGVDDQQVGLGPVGDVGWDRSQQPPGDAAVESDIADDQQVRVDLLGQIH